MKPKKKNQNKNPARTVKRDADPARVAAIASLENFQREMILAAADCFEAVEIDDAGREMIMGVRRKLTDGFLATADDWIKDLQNGKGPDSPVIFAWINRSRSELPDPRVMARRYERRAPLREMIAAGKDPFEATLMFITREILNDANCWDDDSLYLQRQSAKEQKQRQSLRWNADHVADTLTHGEQPTAWFYDPVLAEYCKAAWHKRHNLNTALTNLENVAEYYPWIKKKPIYRDWLKEDLEGLSDLADSVIEQERELFLVIGFCLGAKSYRREIAGRLDGVQMDLLSNYTIAQPEAGIGEL